VEYRLAFDMASAAIARTMDTREPVLLVASAPVFVSEALTRAMGSVAVFCDSTDVTAMAWALPVSGDLPNGAQVEIVGLQELASRSRGRFPAAIWASPQRETWWHRLRMLEDVLSDDALLVVLTASTGGRLLSRWRREWSPGEPEWTGNELYGMLTCLGYRQEYAIDLAGPRGILSTGLGRLADMVARPDLTDRLEASRRLTLAEDVVRGFGQFRVVMVRKSGSG